LFSCSHPAPAGGLSVELGKQGSQKSVAAATEQMSVDTIENLAVLGALLLFGSLSLGVIVLIY